MRNFGSLPHSELVEGFCLAICHDLRAPVAAAGAAVQGLARELPAHGDEALRFLAIAQQSLAKADELLGTLPGLLRSDATSPPRRVPLDELLAVVEDDLDLELRLAGGEIHRSGSLPCVLGDPSRLRIALRNLLQNAIRYRRAEVPLQIRIRAWRRGGRWTITLADNGMGLASGTSPATGGLGLGLAIARRAIEASGGEIAVSSRPGAGTSFAITLQAADGSDGRASRASHG